MGSLLDTTGSKQHVPHRTLRPLLLLLLLVFFYFSFIPYYILFYWGVRTDVLFVPSGRGKWTERKPVGDRAGFSVAGLDENSRMIGNRGMEQWAHGTCFHRKPGSAGCDARMLRQSPLHKDGLM